ncbi:hypothetical protein E1301_Tti021685 [Triplophysa tibetana]|uniref:Uncharacterized protein n=1 Tax=Triplophysa tibetana TaxID=1572043 RepID=A0A5A9PAU4_9TELE|nr:hypothetical protein E1301_Tti021685 [Triplophysa tibetana]
MLHPLMMVTSVVERTFLTHDIMRSEDVETDSACEKEDGEEKKTNITMAHHFLTITQHICCLHSLLCFRKA